MLFNIEKFHIQALLGPEKSDYQSATHPAIQLNFLCPSYSCCEEQ